MKRNSSEKKVYVSKLRWALVTLSKKADRMETERNDARAKLARVQSKAQKSIGLCGELVSDVKDWSKRTAVAESERDEWLDCAGQLAEALSGDRETVQRKALAAYGVLVRRRNGKASVRVPTVAAPRAPVKLAKPLTVAARTVAADAAVKGRKSSLKRGKMAAGYGRRKTPVKVVLSQEKDMAIGANREGGLCRKCQRAKSTHNPKTLACVWGVLRNGKVVYHGSNKWTPKA